MTNAKVGGREQGTILLLAVIFTLVISLLVAGTVSTSLSEARSAGFSLDHAEAMALAEGVTESAQKEMLVSVANFNAPSLSGVVDLGGNNYTYSVQPIGGSINRTDSDGVTMAIQPYLLSSQVDIGESSSSISRVIELTMTPIFQFMIFYSNDLELLPGPSMTLGGRVHANGDMFVGCGGTLTVDTDYFQCTGSILRERKDNGTTTGGTVDIKLFEDSTYAAMSTAMDSSAADWIDLALNTWNGTVKDGAHGVSEVEAPNIGSIKAFDAGGNPGYYHENADLVIVDNQAFDTDGNPVVLPAGAVTEVSMFDGRENQYVTVTQIDISLLNTSGAFPANGLLYAYRTDATQAQPNGVRLTNGSELAAPLTVVTEDPIYVQGDYNTVDKKGAAVMSDAVNLLSNAWDDSKGPGSLPGASDTLFNLAMVTGNVPTPDGGGSYSGGFENLPRFHENWSGRTCSIRGSFIKIFESEIAVSPWSYGGQVYTAPGRDWLFDPDLNNVANMPPFTPNAVYFRRVTWDDNVPIPFESVTALVVDEED